MGVRATTTNRENASAPPPRRPARYDPAVKRSGRVAATVLVLAAAAATVASLARSAEKPTAGPVVANTTLLGAPLHFETPPGRDVSPALLAAVTAAREAAAALESGGAVLAALHTAAGSGPQKVPAPLPAVLARTLAFCRWSQGTHGPLGGSLYALWGLRERRPSLPGDDAVEQAIAAAACDRLTVDATAGTVTLAPGSRVDLWGFAAGAVLDRAAESLAAHGIRNASLTLGGVQRGVGPGPDGRGWPLRVVVPPALAGFTSNLELRDQAFTLVSTADGELRAGGETYAPYLDQRRGRPVAGVVATVAVTELALDAQALATTLFITGTRRGSLLLGQLQPPPAALWMLGDGKGEPLVTDYRWGFRRRRGTP